MLIKTLTSRHILLLCLLFSPFWLHARVKRDIQQAQAVRLVKAPSIDGVLEPEIWGQAMVIEDFVQHDPLYLATPSQRTQVRIMYDDYAIYIGAMLYDSAPDSILKQLGPRDSSLNSDAFGIRFDTYNNQLDAYTFEVSAAGVQRDFRRQDGTYDGVWQSAVKIHENGWTVEMRIPYAALRFPATHCQVWGMQIYRSVRRHRETNHWAAEQRDVSNNLINWGQLTGICDVKSPLRLSLTPYLSSSVNHYPHNVDGISNTSYSFGGGMDLKYGINDSFTLDMTLMPDFSQVPSDNVVKNLSAFETVHGEQRPFFQETMDLFNRGGLFYSRRIGKRPTEYNAINNKLQEGESIKDNPAQAKLVNAIKLTGRTKNGLGVGVFNAVMDNTYARVEHENGEVRKILTEPASNYNIVVFDQALPNNSSAYLINTNVLRSGQYRHANVTGAGANISEKRNTYFLNISGALSQLYNKVDTVSNLFNVSTGKKFDISTGKNRGNFQFTLRRHGLDPHFNDNDMGLTHTRNQLIDRVDVRYNVYEPIWVMRNWRNTLTLRNETLYENYQTTNLSVEYNTNGTTQNYIYLWQGMSFNPIDRLDYYEPRVSGRYFVRPKGINAWAGLSSDYRKAFAFDLQFNYGAIADFDNTNLSYRIGPRYRVNDQLSLAHSLRLNFNQNDVGYAGRDNGQIIFGNRDVTTIENVLSSDYIVSNDVYFSFRMRQYWSKGAYEGFYKLEDNGQVDRQQPYPYTVNRDFNFNSFNIDLVFTWLFAPGSSLNLVWKNAILHEKNQVVNNYFDNFGLLKDSPQYNSFSLKILYYLDYQQLRGA